ncbi:MAG: AraC family transcriptional regulator [Christensenella sp.]|uniref:AraC family transcriptional regulator n=1 Tax=Christensenella sp. TaxID=1935934 RepID=UPI002B1EDEFC|nr:AraC family transcriptional regulator [Christensenella sp.]MEA5003758.1 AraC family transcriptional regulator [Christensenella sp.]
MANIVQKKEYELVKLISGLDIEAHITRVIGAGKTHFHWHKELEFVQVVDGPVVMHMEDESVTLDQGDIFIVNANELHCFQKTGVANDILILQIPLRHFQSYYPELFLYRFYDRHLKKDNSTLLKTTSKYIADIFRSIAHKEECYQLEVMGFVNLLVRHIVCHVPHEVVSEERRMADNRNLQRIDRITNAIHDRYAYGITLDDVARQEGLSRHYTSHFIRKHLGLSFQQYVRRLRLEKAVDLLLHTDKKKLDICIESGFSDYRYLCRAFAEEYGCTPSAFRERHRAVRRKTERTGETFNDQYIIIGDKEAYDIYFGR